MSNQEKKTSYEAEENIENATTETAPKKKQKDSKRAAAEGASLGKAVAALKLKIKANKKKVENTVIISVAVLAGIAMMLLMLMALGVFDFSPDPTYYASFNFDNGLSIHIELYGEQAPETVEHFVYLCQDPDYYGETYFENMFAHTLVNDLLYIGSEDAAVGDGGLHGEFLTNGFNNKISMKEGVVCMARGEDKDSAYGQFFILTEDMPELKGEYAAFGKVSNLEALEEFLNSLVVSSDGTIDNAPKIISVSVQKVN